MARTIQTEQQVLVEPWWAKIRIVYIGLGLGLTWWVLASILRHYVVEPLACRDLATASACVNSFGVAGSIATVIVAILGAFILVKALQPRPIVIALATAILLWDLGLILSGLVWWETLLWGLFFYTASYVLFSMVARIRSLVISLILAALIVVAIRILLAIL